MTREKVLLIEDVREVQVLVTALLQSICDIHVADTLQKGHDLLQNSEFSLLLLDGSLPDGDGFEFCKNLRGQKRFEELPIIFLTGRNEVQHKVLGFSIGADDYITKPLEPVEFQARILAKLKRIKSQSTLIRFENYQIDLKRMKVEVKRCETSEELNLTPSEFKIFAYLCRNRGETISRAQLIEQVWGERIHVTDHTVDTHVSSLRKKLGADSTMIKSVVKNGFKVVPRT